MAENNELTPKVAENAGLTPEVAENAGLTPEVAEKNISPANGVDRMKAMAGNNDFMTGLLDLLKTGNNDFMKIVTSQPSSYTEQVNVKYCLSLLEQILNQAMDFANDVADNTRAKGNQGQSISLTSPSMGTSVHLSKFINKLYGQIMALQTNDVRQTMKSLFDELSSFSWDAKAVLTLLALSIHYVENWRRAQIHASDNLLCSMARLRGLTTCTSSVTRQTKVFVNLIKEILNFTKCIVEFASNSKDFGEMSASIDIKANFGYIIVSVLGCSVVFRSMISEGNEFLEQHLSALLEQVKKISESFKKQVQDFEQNEEEHLYEKIEEVSNSCTDVVELMAALFCTKNDTLTVYHCSERTTVEELKNKSVMLLISDLNLSNDDLATLTGIYNVSTFDNYEIMWVPIMEAHNESMQKQFLDMRSRMQWYTCTSKVSKTAAKFIQEKWQFRQQTKVVVLNEKGKVVNKDAISMIRLWGWKAFPFTESKGNELWNMQVINWFELVVNKTIYPHIQQCFEMKELLFLYDSAEDSRTVREVEEYLEKINGYSVSYIAIRISTKREQFLTRLENCISSKMQATPDNYDSLTQELLELYTNYKNQGGFAIVARGSSVVVNTRLTDFATVLSQHQTWIMRVNQTQAFEAVFQEHYKQVIVKPRCHRLYVPNMVGNVPERIKCTVCSQYMKTAVTFECCHSLH
ncbi:protein SIEVE ELEMENT OCCLUSION B-like isoform X2 [Syzygium oleosum]|uniref:protein SIEVE ELEMENT OCCLUSION B-like isoform X2 n=1 Tax=Syzygium oleosum TaxID=219896 RepID=UPI0024B93590|nr:protein SIEVE ELEMENT OCCLUSION B-like isoform X2 [Syzygium oleosum]